MSDNKLCVTFECADCDALYKEKYVCDTCSCLLKNQQRWTLAFYCKNKMILCFDCWEKYDFSLSPSWETV